MIDRRRILTLKVLVLPFLTLLSQISLYMPHRVIQPSSILSWCSGHQWHLLSTVQTPLWYNPPSSLSQTRITPHRPPEIWHSGRALWTFYSGSWSSFDTVNSTWKDIRHPGRSNGVMDWWNSHRSDPVCSVMCQSSMTITSHLLSWIHLK